MRAAGAGCGLVTLVLLLRGFDVITTDKLSALPLLRENVDAFYAQYSIEQGAERSSQEHVNTEQRAAAPESQSLYLPRVSVVAFDWTSGEGAEALRAAIDAFTAADAASGSDGDATNRPPHALDLVVCSDCVYASTVVSPLVQCLSQVLHTKCICLEESVLVFLTASSSA